MLHGAAWTLHGERAHAAHMCSVYMCAYNVSCPQLAAGIARTAVRPRHGVDIELVAAKATWVTPSTALVSTASGAQLAITVRFDGPQDRRLQVCA